MKTKRKGKNKPKMIEISQSLLESQGFSSSPLFFSPRLQQPKLFPAVSPLPPSFSSSLFIDLGLKGAILEEKRVKLGFSDEIRRRRVKSRRGEISGKIFAAGEISKRKTFGLWTIFAAGEIVFFATKNVRISLTCLHESCSFVS